MRKRTTYTTLTLELHTAASTVAITHVCQLLYQEIIRRAHTLRAHQKLVATIETMSEASEQIKAYPCIAPSTAM